MHVWLYKYWLKHIADDRLNIEEFDFKVMACVGKSKTFH